MNNSTSISVLMSVYVKEKPEFLDIAMESIWDKQTHKPDEVVLVKDGPLTAELDSVISKWQKKLDSQLFVVPLEKNVGLAVALNNGLKACNGSLIMRMDTDDIARPNRFEKQLEFMDSHSEVGICGMGTSEFYEDGRTTENVFPSDHEMLLGRIHKASPFAHPTVCFRKDIIKKLNGYPIEFHLCEDIGLWFKAAKGGVIFANLPDIGLDFRVMNNFYNRRSYSKAFSELRAYWIGVFALYRFNWRLLFPFLRFITRIMPNWINKLLYQSSIRQKLLRK